MANETVKVLKLGQVLAVERNIRGNKEKSVNKGIQEMSRAGSTEGFSKNFTPEGDFDKRPPEQKLVQVNARQVVADIRRSLSDLFRITAQKDQTNCEAKADLNIDGDTLLQKVPVTHLLFLEKQITVEILGAISKIPTLDPADQWDHDPNSGLYRTKETETRATQKKVGWTIIVQATKEHPAQVKEISEDVTIGRWRHVKMSGSLPKPVVDQLQERASKLLLAVKQAREAANMESIKEFDSTPVLDYVFAPLDES